MFPHKCGVCAKTCGARAEPKSHNPPGCQQENKGLLELDPFPYQDIPSHGLSADTTGHTRRGGKGAGILGDVPSVEELCHFRGWTTGLRSAAQCRAGVGPVRGPDPVLRPCTPAPAPASYCQHSSLWGRSATLPRARFLCFSTRWVVPITHVLVFGALSVCLTPSPVAAAPCLCSH